MFKDQNNSPLEYLESIFYCSVFPFEQFAGEIFGRPLRQLHPNCQGRVLKESKVTCGFIRFDNFFDSIFVVVRLFVN